MEIAVAPDAAALPLRPLTYDDLQALPADGHRYELIDGVLLMSPAPRHRHQIVLGAIAFHLHQLVPDGLNVVFAPADVKFSDSTVLEPDVFIAHAEVFTERFVDQIVLAVEVLSPSSQRIDRVAKFSVYQDHGVPNYWIVDPDEPSIDAYRLDSDTYVQVGSVSGDESLMLDEPFPIELNPLRLWDKLPLQLRPGHDDE